jgi:hypothetical protein
MKKICLSILLFFSPLFAENLSKTMLFNGSNLEHWRTYQCECITDGWQIVDKILVRAGPARDLITKEKFKNFILELEWKISKGGNSGIIIRASEDLQYSFMSGIEMQILDDMNHPDGQNPFTSSGAVYDLYPNQLDITNSFNEWNKVRIIAINASVKFFLNEVLVNNVVISSDAWRTAIGNSKFSEYKNFGLLEEGHIALQDHGNEVAFKNITITRL